MKKKEREEITDPRREFIRLARSIDRHQLWRVFADFCEMAALSIACAIPPRNLESPRELRYKQIADAYTEEERDRIGGMFACVVLGLEQEPADFLGPIFQELELSNHWHGQFFTPMELARLMASVTVGDGEDVKQRVKERGFVMLGEPACGAGVMVIAFAEALKLADVNPQTSSYFDAVDVDATAAHMAYVQLSLLGLPGRVTIGNSLSLETRDVFVTPMHHIGMWSWKLARGRVAEEPEAPVGMTPVRGRSAGETKDEAEIIRPKEQTRLW
jgi:N-6 DNA methylase